MTATITVVTVDNLGETFELDTDAKKINVKPVFTAGKPATDDGTGNISMGSIIGTQGAVLGLPTKWVAITVDGQELVIPAFSPTEFGTVGEVTYTSFANKTTKFAIDTGGSNDITLVAGQTLTYPAVVEPTPPEGTTFGIFGSTDQEVTYDWGSVSIDKETGTVTIAVAATATLDDTNRRLMGSLPFTATFPDGSVKVSNGLLFYS